MASALATWYRLRPAIERGVVAAAVLLLAAWPWLAELVTRRPAFAIALVANTGIAAILTISLNLAMGYSGLLSIVHTGLLAFGGYASAALAVHLGWSFWITMLVGIVLTAAFSALIAAVSLRATYLYFGMITLAFNLVVIEVARQWTPVTGGYYGLVGIPPPGFFGQPLTTRQLYLVILGFTILAYVFQRNLIWSKPGRAFQAVRESNDTAAALGIRPGPTKVLAFTLSGGMAGLAGALFAHQLNFINPEVGLLDNALVVFVGLLLGGLGTLSGPLLGVAFVTILDQFIKDLGQARRLILGLVLLAAMMLIPKGIVGSWRSSRWGRQVELPDDDSEPAREVEVTIPSLSPEEARAGEPVILAHDVHKYFGGVRALSGVDLEVIGGEIHGIIGPNGSGKSTLLNCATAYYRPTRGDIRLFGAPLPGRPWRVAAQGVVRVFQKPHLFERVSVLENVLTGMHLRARQHWLSASLRLSSFRQEERALRDEAVGYLALAGLAGRAHRLASSLTHGQKRLLEVARAVAARPRILILDEPATGVTSDELEDLAVLIRRLRTMGLTVVLVEHNMEFLMGLVDRVTVLDSGQVIAVGTPEEVRASPEVQRAYLGSGDLLEQYL